MQEMAVAKRWEKMEEVGRKNIILKVKIEVLPEDEAPAWCQNHSEEELARISQFRDLPIELQSVLVAGLTKKGFSLDRCEKRLVLV